MTYRSRSLLCLLAAAIVTGGSAPLAQPPAPSLVVVIVVDQMRRDYIDDYGARWTKGLRRLIDQGAWFTAAAYPYLTTLTCAGHATIATGTLPSTHGIISNQWWDRDTQQVVSCTSDPGVREVPYADRQPGGGGSARQLRAPTLAQALAAARNGRGRVVALSLKRASAAMLAGPGRGDAVLWLQGGGFSSSTAWGQTAEKSLRRFADGNPILDDFGKLWNRGDKTASYKYEDNGLGEKPSAEWDPVFPHALQPRDGRRTTFFYQAWDESPYADAYVGRLAGAAIDGMKLGQQDGIDFLGISFSALDVVGHDFGPRSHEIQDVLFRLDETIGRLLDQLDKKVGADKYVVALVADHGVAVIPEQASRDGQDAGRIKMGDIMTLVDETVSKKFGRGRWAATEAYSEFYFRAGVFDRIAADPDLLAEVLRAIGTVPGVARVFDSRQLSALAAGDDPLARAAAASYFPGRTGDLVIVTKPNWIFVSDDKTAIPGNATTHGSPYPYDTQVPLVLAGAGVKPGKYDAAATPADLAPTLARIAGVPLPTATGRVLGDALK